MPILKFPPIESADEQGIVAIGGDLHVESLKLAYKKGIFPWPISEDYPLAWFSPNPRAVFDLNNIHIPKKLKKFINNCSYKITYNTAFERVIRKARDIHQNSIHGTWITEEVIAAYIQLFREGHAYSVEVWEDKELIGGLYGVCFGKFINGESMFHIKDNASKIALLSILSNIKRADIKYFDTQMITNVTGSLGAIEIERPDFLEYVAKTTVEKEISFQNFSLHLDFDL